MVLEYFSSVSFSNNVLNIFLFGFWFLLLYSWKEDLYLYEGCGHDDDDDVIKGVSVGGYIISSHYGVYTGIYTPFHSTIIPTDQCDR